MRKEDLTAFEYRAGKVLGNTDDIIRERLYGNYEPGVVRTQSAGPVNFMIYRPSYSKEEDILPAVFSFHGGGFVLAFYETDGKYCQKLADLSGCAVINIDYPVAPEYKYPIPILASYETISLIKEKSDLYRIDPRRLAVCGHSSGGAISANMCILDEKRKEIGLKAGIIDYAPLRQSLNEKDRPAIDPSKAIAVSRMQQYIQWYFNDYSQMEEPMASPLNADLSGVCPLLVIGAELDSLCHEDELFAKKAAESEVDVKYMFFQNCRHGFTHAEFDTYDKENAELAWKSMAEFIQEKI